MTRIAWLGATLGAFLAPWAWAAEIDQNALYRHLKKSFSLPPGLELELKDVRPSHIPGFLAGRLESRFKGNTQSQSIQLTDDGRYYFLGDAYALAASSVPGLLMPLSPAGSESAPPQCLVTQDAKHLLVGGPHDLSTDPDAANLSKIGLKQVMAHGPADAPVLVVEYSDMQCPYCRTAHLALEKQLPAAYGNKVRWVFKHNPLTNIHPWSYNAAIAVACALGQRPEASWKLQSKIFEEQEKITPANLRDRVSALAKGSGLNPAKFLSCYDGQGSKDRVDADMEEAKALKLNSTPAFLINGRIMMGFRDFDSMKGIIDEMLSEKSGGK